MYSNPWTSLVSIETYSHAHSSKEGLFCAGNKGNHQNFDPFLLAYKFLLIFMAMNKKRKIKIGQLLTLHSELCGEIQLRWCSRKWKHISIFDVTCYYILTEFKFWWLSWFPPHQNLNSICDIPCYSHLFNTRGGWNKHGGDAKVAKSLNVEGGIFLEKTST